jgi:hypothetical protein
MQLNITDTAMMVSKFSNKYLMNKYVQENKNFNLIYKGFTHIHVWQCYQFF